MSDVAPQSSGVWSGVVNPAVVVEVLAPDGSQLWLDQASGSLYESFGEPPLSRDALPEYVRLSSQALVAVAQVDQSGAPVLDGHGSLVVNPATGAVYDDTDFERLVGVSVPGPDTDAGSRLGDGCPGSEHRASD